MSKTKGCHSKPKHTQSHKSLVKVVIFRALRIILVRFLDDMRRHELKSGTMIAHDERSSDYFVDVWIESITEAIGWKS